MSGSVCVPISNELLARLVARYPDGFVPVIEDVVNDFLERTAEDWAALESLGREGYVWDQLYLPNGTVLRTKHRGEWQVATVEKAKFIYEGKFYNSPSKVCNAMRGDTSNNAWLTLEIQRPQDIGFRIADRHRRNK